MEYRVGRLPPDGLVVSATSAAPASRISPRLVFWLILAMLAVALYPVGEVLRTIGHLQVRDPDDAMRLVEVRDLVAGQAWFDNTQHRFLAPGGVLGHWSRLVDAPMAGAILLLTPFLGPRLAEGITAALWPPLLLGLYGTMVFLGLRRVLGTRAAALSVLVALQTLGLTVQFSPGRVDHHNVQILVVVGVSLCMIRAGLPAGLLGGACAALSLAVGLEGLPFLGAAALLLAADWLIRGHPALPAFLGFGLGLGVAAPLLFAAQTSPALWATTACDALSPPWLWLATGGAVIALISAALDRRLATVAARLGLAGGLGAVLLGGFALLFPSCLGGPFPGMPALVRDRWLLTVNEMSSLPMFLAKGQWSILVYYAPLAVATLGATWSALRGPEGLRRHHRVVAAFLWPGLILSLAQFRGLYLASGFIPLVAGPAIDRAIRRFGEAAPLRERVGGAVPALAMIGQVWFLAFLALSFAQPTEGAADRNAVAASPSCNSQEALAPLAVLPPGRVLAPIEMGPAILLHTSHAILAAPYHRAIPGLLAAIEGLGGSEADLRRHAGAQGVGYLVVCPGEFAADLEPETAFATRLATGAASAPWLEPVPVKGSRLLVWRVR